MASREAGFKKYAEGLEKVAANYGPLTPLSFLEMAAANFPARPACVYGDDRKTYAELYARARRLASALIKHGIEPGDTVALFAPNVPACLEAHYGVPMARAVLNPINIRRDAEAVAFILDHGEAKAIITDREFSPVVGPALERARVNPIVIDIDDPAVDGAGDLLGEFEYEAFLEEGDPDFAWLPPEDEWDPIALSYTSGTTGNPKGVVYHHRGIFVASTGQPLSWGMGYYPVYLWTLPMFHSYGWCFPYGITAKFGTHVMLRKIDSKDIFDLIANEGVTHMCGAPIVLNMIINSKPEERRDFPQTTQVMTAGSAPPPTVLEGMAKLGFEVIHAYGLTECSGCVTACFPKDDWSEKDTAAVAGEMARQGVRYATFQGLMVADPETMTPVPKDGEAIGEIMTKGHPVMRGYLKNPKATAEAFADGWFHTGDLAVWYDDGYIQVRDRSKDIIISGGENISSIEVEGLLYKHPDVLEAAVVSMPHARWEETPCAFVTLRDGAKTTEQDIVGFCRENMAHFKCPTRVVFGELPKTATGKVQKFQLRDLARNL